MSMIGIPGNDFMALVGCIFDAIAENEKHQADIKKEKPSAPEQPAPKVDNETCDYNPCEDCQYHPCHDCETDCCECDYDEMPTIFDCITKVIFQDDYTIIFWDDGTKTSVKCNKEDVYDPEKGLAMALLKSILGNTYYRDMQKIITKYPHVKSKDVKDKKKSAKTPAKSVAPKVASKTTKAKSTKTTNK